MYLNLYTCTIYVGICATGTYRIRLAASVFMFYDVLCKSLDVANCIKSSRAASIALMIALPTFGFALNRMFSD